MPVNRRRGAAFWLPRLTFRGGMFLALGAGLLLLGLIGNQRDLLFIAGLLLAIPLAAVVYVSVRPLRLQVTRMLRPPVVSAGGEAVVVLSLRNLSARPVTGLRLRDTADAGLTLPDSTELPGLARAQGGQGAGADTLRFQYRSTVSKRGVYASGPVLIGRSDPFGLASGEWSVGEPHDLVVTPRVTPLAGRGLASALNDGDVPERLRRLHHNADPLIAREYRPGDPLRRVNWPATARRGEIMVRQEEEQSNPGARLVLDTALRGRRDVPSGAGADAGEDADAQRQGRTRVEQAFEVAVELTASVGVHLLEAGYQVDLVELGPSQLRPSQPSPSQPSPGRPGGGQSEPGEPGQPGQPGQPGEPGEPGTGGDAGRGGLRGEAPAVFRSPGGAVLLLAGLARVMPVDPTGLWEVLEPEAAVPVAPAAQEHPGRAGGTAGTSANRGAGQAGGQAQPTFAVLVSVDARDVAGLANLVTVSRPAVAFVLDTVDPDAVRRLREAGWRCIGLRQARDIPRAWTDFIGEGRPVHDTV
ncbi:DUF58 domain-containing protein [Cryobacterium cryoconiti]|uniref:DUF58 domain-containing protein n=1 Tax=Cryobacterium cryoconiti TaxID=1259239 RepID=A0A4Y8JU48_9MICO|nr:DUF58 domain-containing protein [Cryobacterium cryoconiti]TFD30025.1 DUF58 domain-containing protein [Cryobacterium cryoconiti]